MKRSTLAASACVMALAVAGAAVANVAAAQGGDVVTAIPAGPPLTTIKWFGPFGITPNDTSRFNYTNLGADATSITWAFTNALTGEVVCSNRGKPTQVPAGQGAIWSYSQTLDPKTGEETRHCYGGIAGEEEPGEAYFDSTNRHQLVAWIFITHASPMALRRAVDLPTVELFNSMIMPDGQRSMSFGRTMAFIQANPVAPGDALLARVSSALGR